MNQRPFISTQLNIFDENRCVFSPSMIAGQPVMISQEQNRKICDSLTTAIASNQPRNTSCFCACSPPVYPNQQQIWSCPLQAQKQGIPGGVAFNFSQPNYCCPPSCLPSVYTPPPPPCPQVVDCPHKTPQSICVDFGKFGMEAMAFQQKCRQQCQGFTYDKQVGTSDQVIFPKCNTCCCGVQSVTLNAEQKEELFNKIDQSDSKSKLKICACDPVEKKRCCCFPKPDPNKFGSAKNLVIGERKERSCKDYDIVEQATREADAEAYLCCNCLDKWKKENENRRPSCLKKRCECSDEKQKENKDVSFCFRGSTLEITEEKKAIRPKTEEQPIVQSKIEFKQPSCLSDEDKSEIVKQINEMKRKRKGIVKMAQDFRITAKDYLEQLDKDIDHYRELYKTTKNEKKENFIQRYRCEHLFDNSELETVEEREEEKSRKWIRNIRSAAKTKKEDNEIHQQKENIPPQLLRETGEEKVIKIIPADNEENETAAPKSVEENSPLTTEPNIESSDPENPESKFYDERIESNHDSNKEEQPSLDASSKNVENNSNSEKRESNSEDSNVSQMRQIENEKSEEIAPPKIDNMNNLESDEVATPSIFSEKSNLEPGTSQGGKADIPSDVTDDDNIQNPSEKTSSDQIQTEEKITSIEVTSPDSEQAVVVESSKMNNASQNSTDRNSPKGETITEGSNIYEEKNLEAKEELFEATSKSENPETIIINDGKSGTNKSSEDANNVTEKQSGRKTKVCGGSCSKYRENKNIDEGHEGNIVESKLDNKEENDEFSNRNKSKVKQNYNEISENKDASTSKMNETKQPVDHVSFSAQQSGSDEIIVINKEEKSTSDPQKSDDGKRGNYCSENSACRKIIQYMYDQDDDEPNRNRCDIREIYEFCNCCKCYEDDGICYKESKNLVFKPCSRERSTTNSVGNVLSNIYSSALEKAGNLLSFITSFRSPCSSGQPFYENPHILTNRQGCGAGCYARRIRRHIASLNVPRNVCPCRMDTNRFCGKTCYDYDNNRWYSCCEGFNDGQKVVKITFKETAERRTVRLENNCRNSRYHVVYE
ncbi:uncharacterized protein PF11_0213-like [Coccinella septempunctata]|uniref:uncharacterized protein PF11_0213-like n=1 Tax=Coccinella septempunctata TaxID=41139 RepID=UPI001D062E25|nr:uncharacterized protein PF11_0213-like [Coccinella septempunctata]